MYLRTTGTQGYMEVLALVLRAYHLKYGHYPAAKSFAELVPMLSPELVSTVTSEDRWGTELRYVVSKDGRSYRLVSAGADAIFDESSWTKRGKLATADEDAVLEDGELIREWTEETRPGLGPRAKFSPKVRALLAQADAALEARDHAGALTAYMEAVKADRAVADVETLHAYAPPPFSTDLSPDTKPHADPTPLHIAALRQFLELHPGQAEVESELASILPDEEAKAFAAQLLKARPNDPALYRMRSQLHFRTGGFDEGLADLERATTLDPKNAELFYFVGVASYEVASKGPDLTAARKRELISRGLTALTRAEALRADYFESITYRSLLLREQAKLETDPAAQRKLTGEADALRQRAMDLIRARRENPAPPK